MVIKMQSIKENPITSLGSAKIKEKTKNDNPSSKEARETYRKTKKTRSHIPREIKSTNHNFGKIMLKPHNAPILVATPLPPLNLRKIGNICPKTGSIAEKM